MVLFLQGENRESRFRPIGFLVYKRVTTNPKSTLFKPVSAEVGSESEPITLLGSLEKCDDLVQKYKSKYTSLVSDDFFIKTIWMEKDGSIDIPRYVDEKKLEAAAPSAKPETEDNLDLSEAM